MKGWALTPRLRSAAELVRQDAVFADVGTDHAYLPIFLLTEGVVRFSYCTDINEGPLASARRNAEAAGLLSKTEFLLTDGAAALSGKGVTDLAICGMGGELIAEIIERAEWMRKKGINLILGPMSKQAHLRKYLYSRGYGVLEEIYTTDAGKHYLTMLVTFVGERREISDTECELGLLTDGREISPSARKYLRGKALSYEKSVRGKALTGADVSGEREVLSALTSLLADNP
jgi:tRNA (adenine22-N1)-methyltransferase